MPSVLTKPLPGEVWFAELGMVEFWDSEILRNQERDRLVTRALKKAGWRGLRIWEHELTVRRGPQLLRRLRRWVLAEDEAIRAPFTLPLSAFCFSLRP